MFCKNHAVVSQARLSLPARLTMRRVLAAGLLALLASGLYRVWNEEPGAGSGRRQQASVTQPEPDINEGYCTYH